MLVICPASLRKQWAQELHDKFAVPTPLSTPVPETLLANSQRVVAATIAEVLEANQRLFNEERDKLERWADDKLLT